MDATIINEVIEQKQFKVYLPFLKLARDSLATSPLISYWSLYYVIDKGIQSQAQSKTKDGDFNRLLGTLMTALESEKKARKGDPLFENEEQSKRSIENYANQLLVRAEAEAELGVSLTVAVKQYLAASAAYQLLALFGDAASEANAKRIKYCKWKAVTVAKDAKQMAISHSDCEDQIGEASVLETSITGNNDNISNNSTCNLTSDKSQDTLNDQSGVRSVQPDPLNDTDLAQLLNNMALNDPDMTTALLCCKNALKAICDEHIATAITCLKQAIEFLEKTTTAHSKY